MAATAEQGLTLVTFLAQRKRFVYNRRLFHFVQRLLRGCLGGVEECWGVCRVYFASEWLRLSCKVDECKPLPRTAVGMTEARPPTRGLHSCTFRLNVGTW